VDLADREQPVFTVALTGGIASGKTAVSDLFEAHGAAIVDTDRIAHELVEPGQPLLDSIIGTFGTGLLDANGHLKRRALREIVFSNAELREQLENLLHPAIITETRLQIDQARGAYCIAVIPLLAESGVGPWIDRVLLVDADENSQIQRVMQRDKVDPEQARHALDAQASRAQRQAIADDIIVNSGSLEDLAGQVARLHETYTGLARKDQISS